MRLGTHKNHYLQDDWNTYGALNFKFEILERCEEKELNERECYWIAHFKSTEREFGYNIQAGGSHKNKGLVAKPRYSNTTKYKR